LYERRKRSGGSDRKTAQAVLLLEFCFAKLHALIAFTSGLPEVLPRKGL
jgi:hypothetical protein